MQSLEASVLKDQRRKGSWETGEDRIHQAFGILQLCTHRAAIPREVACDATTSRCLWAEGGRCGDAPRLQNLTLVWDIFPDGMAHGDHDKITDARQLWGQPRNHREARRPVRHPRDRTKGGHLAETHS